MNAQSFAVKKGKLDLTDYSHMAFFYEKEKKASSILSKYFIQGIDNGDVCIMVFKSKKMLEDLMKNLGEYSKKMIFIPYKKFYLTKGRFVKSEVLKRIKKLVDSYPSRRIRACGDMSWVDSGFFVKVNDYESEVSKKYCDSNNTLICAYSPDSLKINELIKLIQSHTAILFRDNGRLVISETVERDFFEPKIEELEKFSSVSVNRELKMVELKNRIKELEEEIRRMNSLD